MRKTNPRRIKLTLFWKFAISSIVIVVIFGSINIYLLWSSVYKSFEQEIDKRCSVLATIVAERALTPIVYENQITLYNLLNEIKQSDPTISYIFLLNNKNELIAQSYDLEIPDKLLKVNALVEGKQNIEVLKTLNFENPVIRDIAYPILNGEVGTVRLGIAEQQIQQEISEATTTLILMIILFLILGLAGALFFSYIITKPIKRISQKAQVVDLGIISSEEFDQHIEDRNRSNNWHLEDEMDILVAKFSEMLYRLRSSYLKLEETQSALVQAEKLTSLGTLSSGVAHEINNPISGIKNCINRILKNPENTAQNEQYILMIKESTEKMEQVVQRLLRFSRKEDIHFEKVDINAVIESAIVLTTHKVQAHSIVVRFDRNKVYHTLGSSNHLEQVVVNLILNSVDAIVERQDRVKDMLGEIAIWFEESKDKISFNIKDNGIGIPDENKVKLFDPFFTSKKVGQGTGLGLSVSFTLIKEHNGRITFISNEDVGTTFKIELPIYTG